MKPIEFKILNKYPGLVLNKNLPIIITDDLRRVGGYVPARRLFDTIVSELFVASIYEFLKPELEGTAFFRTDGIARVTSQGYAKKDMANRVAHCFALTYWSDISEGDASTMLNDIIFASQEDEVATEYGICWLRTAIGDNSHRFL